MAKLQDSWRGGGTGRGAYTLTPRAITDVPLTIDLLSGQTADGFRVRNSSGTVLFSIDPSGNVEYLGDETIADALTVTGNIIGGGTLDITGVTTLSTLDTSGNITIGGNLLVDGTSRFTGDVVANHNLTVNNTLQANGYSYFNFLWLNEQVSAPSASANRGCLYTDTGDAGTTELFYLDAAGNAVQITDAGSIEGAEVHFDDDDVLTFGNTQAAPNVSILWETADANANALLFAAPEGGATDVPVFIFADASALNVDLGLFDGTTNPTIAVLSDDHTKSGELSHDGTNFVLAASSGSLQTDLAVLSSDVTISSATPSLNFKDTNCTDSDVNAVIYAQATDTGSGTEDIDVVMQQQVNGTLVSFLSVDADGETTVGKAGQATRINGSSVYVPSGNISVGTANTDLTFTSGNTGTDMKLTLDYGLGVVITNGTQTSGVPYLLKLTPGTISGSTASTAIPNVHFDFDATNRTWATGAITTQNEFQIDAPTYNFVGASTITQANTVYIAGAPIAGANATITGAYSLNVFSGDTYLGGNLETTGAVTTTLGAAQQVYIDASTTPQTQTFGALNISLDSATASVKGIYVNSSLSADVALVAGIKSDITGLAAGGGSSNVMFAFDTLMTGSANDTSMSYSAYNVRDAVKSGGTSVMQAFTCGSNFDVAFKADSGAFIGSNNDITSTSEGVAASVTSITTNITTNGDSDLDNVTLANGTDGQIKVFAVTAVGNAADSVKITPANMIGGTQITFAANPIGLGCVMKFDSGAGGWIVVGNNGGVIA